MATSWTIVERTGGRLLKEDGDKLLLETGFDIIIDYITDFTSRSVLNTSWDISDLRLGLMWSDLDDTWESEVRTWAELDNSTDYTIRTKP